MLFVSLDCENNLKKGCVWIRNEWVWNEYTHFTNHSLSDEEKISSVSSYPHNPKQLPAPGASWRFLCACGLGLSLSKGGFYMQSRVNIHKVRVITQRRACAVLFGTDPVCWNCVPYCYHFSDVFSCKGLCHGKNPQEWTECSTPCYVNFNVGLCGIMLNKWSDKVEKQSLKYSLEVNCLKWFENVTSVKINNPFMIS